MSKNPTPAHERFEALLGAQTHPDGCIEWQGVRNPGGYGQFNRGDRTVLAHRYALEAVEGPSDLAVLHSCDNPPCCNVAHLRYGSVADNNADMKAKRRHQHGEAHHAARLTEDVVAAMRRAVAGRSIREVAEAFGVKYQTACDAIRGTTWGHVTEPAVPRRLDEVAA